MYQKYMKLKKKRLHSMPLFSADTKMFQKKISHENMKKTASKVAHNRPKFFFSVMPTGPNPAQISISVP